MYIVCLAFAVFFKVAYIYVGKICLTLNINEEISYLNNFLEGKGVI